MSSLNLQFDRLRINHLRLLSFIDELGTLRKVAQRLNLTQPALSHMLQQLEVAFGVRLVERRHSGVILNEQGRVALNVLRVHLASLDQLKDSLKDQETPALRIGVNLVVGIDLLPRMATAVKLFEPDNALRMIVHEGGGPDMLNALLTGKIDCYIGRLDWGSVPTTTRARLRSEPLVEVSGAVACSINHPLLSVSELRPEHLLNYAWVLPDPGTFLMGSLDAAFRRYGSKPPKPLLTSNYHIAFNQFRYADLLGAAPKPAVLFHEQQGMIRQLGVDGFLLGYDVIELVALDIQYELPALKKLRSVAQSAGRTLPARLGYRQFS